MPTTTDAATHTPAPWVASKGDEDEPDRWIVCQAGEKPWHIATVENGAPGDTLDTEGANARLIAAAPDLLEACRALVRATADHHWTNRPIDPCCIAEAMDAIAKAEGK